MPTFVLIANDKETERTVGMMEEETLRQWLGHLEKGKPMAERVDVDDPATLAWLAALLLGAGDEQAWIALSAQSSLRHEKQKLQPALQQILGGKYPTALRASAAPWSRRWAMPSCRRRRVCAAPRR